MKTLDEIKKDKRFQIVQRGEDGGNGFVTIRGVQFFVIFSFGGGWDHVSASHRGRCPSWNEMCIIKDIFFREDECCVEYHPDKGNYINFHPYCLHIWRPQKETLPTPPIMYV